MTIYFIDIENSMRKDFNKNDKNTKQLSIQFFFKILDSSVFGCRNIFDYST